MWGQPRTAGRSLRPICQVSGVPPLPPPGTHLHSLPPPSSTISLPPRPATLAKNSPGPRPLPSLLLSGPWKWNGWEEKSTQPRPQNRQSPRLRGLGPQCKKPGGGVPVPAPPVAPSVRPQQLRVVISTGSDLPTSFHTMRNWGDCPVCL